MAHPAFCPHCGAAVVGTMQFCTVCGKRVTEEAPAPVAAAPAPKPKSGNLGVIVGAVVVFVLGLLYVLNGGRFNTTTPAAPDAFGAYYMCKQFVTKSLKAPASAVFPSSTETQTERLSATQFRNHAYVDSQNGFGAMIRTQYTCTVTSTGGDNWRLDALTTDP